MNPVSRPPRSGPPSIGSSDPILAFACDEETLESVARVVPGGRRGVEVREGGVHAAAAAIQQGANPELLIVDLSDSTAPVADINNLVNACGPDTTIVTIGEENDVSLYRALVNAGVTDYLVKPITGQELRRTILAAGRSDEPETQSANGKIDIVVGARGGVGSSSIATAIAWMMAQEHRKQVALVDLDLHFGTISLSLDLEPGNGLRSALENADRIDSLFVASALVNVTENLFVLGGEEPMDQAFNLEPEALDLLIGELRRIFDVIIIDLPRHLLPQAMGTVIASDRIVVVSDLSLAGLRDVVRIRTGLQRMSPDLKTITVVNRAGLEKASELSRPDFERGLDGKIDFLLPEDPKAAKATLNGKPLVNALKGASGDAFQALTRAVAGIEVGNRKGRRWFSRG